MDNKSAETGKGEKEKHLAANILSSGRYENTDGIIYSSLNVQGNPMTHNKEPNPYRLGSSPMEGHIPNPTGLSHKQADNLRSLVDIRRSFPDPELHFNQTDGRQVYCTVDEVDRKKSRSRSNKHKKSSSRKIKFSQLIIDQNMNVQMTPPSSVGSEQRPKFELKPDKDIIRRIDKDQYSESPHVHFADQQQVLNSSQRVTGQKQYSPRDSNAVKSDSHSKTLPEILNDLSQTESSTPKEQPLTGVQEYELSLLEEKKKKLLQKLDKFDQMIHQENEEIVAKEVELTEVDDFEASW